MTIQVNEENRQEFMAHAYNAMFSGRLLAFDPELQTKMVDEIMTDVCSWVRRQPPAERDAFIAMITQQIRTS